MAGWSGLVKYYNIEGVTLECWKISTCETRTYPRDRSFCDYLLQMATDGLDLPLMTHETHEDGVNVYVLMPAKTRG